MISETFEEHLERLDMVLQRLQSIDLKRKSSKCHFLQSEVLYLGHRVSVDGISTDPDTIVAVQGWLVPNSLKQLRSFWDLPRITGIMFRVSATLPVDCMIL